MLKIENTVFFNMSNTLEKVKNTIWYKLFGKFVSMHTGWTGKYVISNIKFLKGEKDTLNNTFPEINLLGLR